MASKNRLEHKAKYLQMGAGNWDDELRKIEKMCDKMQKDGWMLHTMALPDQKNAVLVFTRARKD